MQQHPAQFLRELHLSPILITVEQPRNKSGNAIKISPYLRKVGVVNYCKKGKLKLRAQTQLPTIMRIHFSRKTINVYFYLKFLSYWSTYVPTCRCTMKASNKAKVFQFTTQKLLWLFIYSLT